MIVLGRAERDGAFGFVKSLADLPDGIRRGIRSELWQMEHFAAVVSLGAMYRPFVGALKPAR